MIEKKPVLIFEAPVSSRSGYGGKSRDIVNSILDLEKYDVKIVDTPWGTTPRNALEEITNTNDRIKSHLLTTPTLNTQPEIYIKVGIPNEMRKVAKYNIHITSLVESDKVDVSWIENINKTADLVIAPSEFSRHVLINTVYEQVNKETNQVINEVKTTVPVEVLFEGLDTDTFKKIESIPSTITEELSTIKENFLFLFCGHWLPGKLGEDRKDVGMMVKTFLETFKNKTNAPALLLKVSCGAYSIIDREIVLQKINEIKSTVSGGTLPNIYLLYGDLTGQELNGLYHHPKVKSYVSFTKGEGFGRPTLEFAVTGKPIVVSNWSGHLDYLAPEFNVLLPGKLTNVHKSAQWKQVIIKGSKWFTVEYVYASKVLKDVHKNYKSYLEKSRKQAHLIKKNWSLYAMTTMLGKILDKYIPEFPKEVTMNIPKLKKVGASAPPKANLPKLKKIN